MTKKQNPHTRARAVQYSDKVSTSEYSPSQSRKQATHYWNRQSNSVELLDHWIACRGHRFGYAEVIE